MKKSIRILALALSIVMTLSLLTACGGEPAPAPDKPSAPEPAPSTPAPSEPADAPEPSDPEPAAGDAKPAEAIAMGEGYNCGFVMDLPAGYAYSDAWSCYENAAEGVRIWVADANFYNTLSELEGAEESYGGNARPVETRELPTAVIEEPEGFYGAMSHYYVTLGDFYDDWYGCHLLVSSEKGDMAATQSAAVLACIDTIRKSGEAVGDRAAVIAEREAAKEDPYKSLSISFTPADTTKMSNFVSSGKYAYEGDTVYGHFFAEDGTAELVRVDFKKDGVFADVESYTVLDSGFATYITLVGDCVYYIKSNESVYRVPKTGGEPELVIAEASEYLQCVNGKLYYCDYNYNLRCADTDGGNIETVLDFEVYYPYFINDRWLIYQLDADGESLHLRHIPSGEDIKVTNGISYSPVISGSDLYCVYNTGEGFTMARFDLSDPKNGCPVELGEKPMAGHIFITADNSLYYGLENGLDLSLWKDAENPDGTVEADYRGLGEDYNIYWYTQNGLVNAIYVTKLATGAGQQMPRF